MPRTILGKFPTDIDMIEHKLGFPVIIKTLRGTRGGISGGPMFDATGAVRGVIVAESPRRGRIYTTAPQSVEAFLTKRGVPLESGPADKFELSGYGAPSDNARRRLQVVKVTCEVTP